MTYRSDDKTRPRMIDKMDEEMNPSRYFVVFDSCLSVNQLFRRRMPDAGTAREADTILCLHEANSLYYKLSKPFIRKH